jgi:hypothetical protein
VAAGEVARRVLAMLRTGSNGPAGFLRAGMRDFDVLPMPRWRTHVHCFGSSCIGIAKATKQREADWLLLRFTGRRPTHYLERRQRAGPALADPQPA